MTTLLDVLDRCGRWVNDPNCLVVPAAAMVDVLLDARQVCGDRRPVDGWLSICGSRTLLSIGEVTQIFEDLCHLTDGTAVVPSSR